jgi:hypothetical protein
MKKFNWMLIVVAVILSAGFGVKAQTTTLPKSYTVTETVGYFGEPFSLVIARKGNMGYMKHWKQGTNVVSSLTVVKIDKGEEITWDPNQKPLNCGKSTFTGSWGDPFEDNASLMDDLKKLNGKQVGTEQFLGVSANVWEAVAPEPTGKVRAWVDAKSGAVLKIASMPVTGAPKVLTEITQLSLAAPVDALFKTPPECDAVANAPKPPTEDEQIKELTNDDPGNYVRAITSPESKESCTVVYKVVLAGTMKPIAPTFTVATDIGNVGGTRHKATGVNGVYRLANVPSNFDLETDFGEGGGSFALIHRQCFGPETVLLYVIKNPAKITDGGDYLWVKSGKYAGK